MKRLPDIDTLRTIANTQCGFVTAKQAGEASITQASLSMMVKREKLERVDRAIYRVPFIEPTIYDRYMLALLWTGCEEAALSHATALETYDVCDIEPRAIDISIAADRRIRKAGGEGYAIHCETIPSSDLCWWENMRRTKLATAISQCTDDGVSSHVLLQAIEKGLAKGLITKENADELAGKIGGRDGR